jgi:hypothetical protein
MDSEEVISQSHVSFCRLTQALTRYRRKTKPGREHIGARLFTGAKNPCHSSPAGKPEGRFSLLGKPTFRQVLSYQGARKADASSFDNSYIDQIISRLLRSYAPHFVGSYLPKNNNVGQIANSPFL